MSPVIITVHWVKASSSGNGSFSFTYIVHQGFSRENSYSFDEYKAANEYTLILQDLFCKKE